MSSSKLQDADFKSATEAGAADRLTDDTKVYVTAKSLNKTLGAAIATGDVGSSATPIVAVASGSTYSVSSTQSGSLFNHTASTPIVYTLPAAAAGLRFSFLFSGIPFTSSYNLMSVKPNTSNKIVYANKTVENPGYLNINKKGVLLTLFSPDSITWEVETVVAQDHIKNTTIGDIQDISLVGRNSWISKTALPNTYNSSETTGFDLNGYGYKSCGGSPYNSATYQYNTNTDGWTQKANMNRAAYGIAGADNNGYGYIMGGAYFSSCDQYNDSTNVWTPKGSMSGNNYSCQAGALNGYVYVPGGYGAPNLSRVEMFNDGTNSWSLRTPMSFAGGINTIFNLNGYLYSAGGSPNNSATEQYNDSSNAWVYRMSVSGTLAATPGQSLNGYGVGLGGYYDSSPSTVTPHYNDSLNTWTNKAGMINYKVYPATFAISGYAYATAGSQPGGFGFTTEQYN